MRLVNKDWYLRRAFEALALVALFTIAYSVYASKESSLWDALNRYPLFSRNADHRMAVEVFTYDGMKRDRKEKMGRDFNPIIVEPYAKDEYDGVCFKYKSGHMDCFYAEDISEY